MAKSWRDDLVANWVGRSGWLSGDAAVSRRLSDQASDLLAGKLPLTAAGSRSCSGSLLRTTWPGQILAVFSLGTALLLALVSIAQVPESLSELRVPVIGLWIAIWLGEDRERRRLENLAAILAGSCFLADLWSLANAGNRPALGLQLLILIILCDCVWLCLFSPFAGRRVNRLQSGSDALENVPAASKSCDTMADATEPID